MAQSSVSRLAASRWSPRRSSALCENAGTGRAPWCASTTRRWTVLDPTSRTPSRITLNATWPTSAHAATQTTPPSRAAASPSRASPPRRHHCMFEVSGASSSEVAMGGKSRGSVRVEPSPKRVRVYLNGELVADTMRPFLVWERPYYPTYYLHAADVRATLIPAGETEHSPSRGDGEVLHVKVATAIAERAALRYPASPLEDLRDLVRLDWNAMSEWLEEDEPVYTHPRDPYKRVDILASSRHVRI